MTTQQTALAQAPATKEALWGAFREPADINARLVYASKNYHLVSPSTACASLPEGCSVALSQVLVDAENETFDVGMGKVALAKAALDRIAAAAGISWDPMASGRLDDGRDPRYCAWKAVGRMRHLDGSEIVLVASKEMDLRDGSPQVEVLIAKALAKKRDPQKQINEMRLHIMAHAETKARLRAVRSIGIRSAYRPEELQKPFVVARIMWTGQSNNPELARAFAMKTADAMLGGVKALYGESAPAAAPAPRFAAPPVGQSYEDSLPAGIPVRSFVEPSYGQVVPIPPPTPQPVAQQAVPAAAAPPVAAPPVAQAAPPVAAAGRDPGAVCGFGKNKGTPLSQLEDEDLEWMAGAIRTNIANPEKAKWRAKNEAELAAVAAELRWRSGEDDPPGDDDERL